MRSALTLAGAVVINAAAWAVMEWNVTQAQLPPPGEVIITQLDQVTPVAPLAQTRVDGHVVVTASSL